MGLVIYSANVAAFCFGLSFVIRIVQFCMLLMYWFVYVYLFTGGSVSLCTFGD